MDKAELNKKIKELCNIPKSVGSFRFTDDLNLAWELRFVCFSRPFEVRNRYSSFGDEHPASADFRSEEMALWLCKQFYYAMTGDKVEVDDV